MATLLHNGLIHDAVHEAPFTGDLLIEGDKITAIDANLEIPADAQVADASLEVGKDADIAFASGNLFELHSRIVATYINGKRMFSA